MLARVKQIIVTLASIGLVTAGFITNAPSPQLNTNIAMAAGGDSKSITTPNTEPPPGFMIKALPYWNSVNSQATLEAVLQDQPDSLTANLSWYDDDPNRDPNPTPAPPPSTGAPTGYNHTTGTPPTGVPTIPTQCTCEPGATDPETGECTYATRTYHKRWIGLGYYAPAPAAGGVRGARRTTPPGGLV